MTRNPISATRFYLFIQNSTYFLLQMIMVNLTKKSQLNKHRPR